MMAVVLSFLQETMKTRKSFAIIALLLIAAGCGYFDSPRRKAFQALDEAVRLDGMLHALMFTLSGVPVLYSGDEIAQENDNTYHDDPLKAEDSRYLHRGDMDWQKAEKRKDPGTTEGRVFAEIARQEQLRKKYGVFDDGADVWIQDTGNDQVLGIGRYYLGEKLLAVFNFSKEPQVAWIHDETMYTDLETGRRCKAGSVKVPAGGFRWLYKRF